MKNLVLSTAVAVAFASSASAATIQVTQPEGLLTNTSTPGSAGLNDPAATDTWLRRNVRQNSSIGITGDYTRSGNGSMYFSGANGGSKADAEYYFSDLTGKTLGNLSSLSYDSYRDSSSGATDHLHPSLRVLFDADGNMGTADDRGYLVYENTYNGQTTPEDGWQSIDVFNLNGAGQSANVWMVNFGNVNGSVLSVYDRSIQEWIAGAFTSNYPTLSAQTLIYGLSSGIGSGWGAFEGAVDNITIGFGGESTTYNFELAQVPEPATLGLLGLGILGIAASRRRRG